jgi:hypothetical protein
LIFAFVTVILLSVVYKNTSYAINGSILGIPVVLAAILFLYSKKKEIDLSVELNLFPFSQTPLVLLYGITFVLTVGTLLVTRVGSPFYLVGIILLYGIISLQIFSPGRRPPVILGEIMVVMATLIWSITLKYPYYFGSTDIIPHIFMSLITEVSGRVIPQDLTAYASYTYFPLYHVFIAQAAQLLGIDVKTALFVITTPVYVAVAASVYYLSERILQNQQIALVVALMFSMTYDVVFYGTYMVTRTMAFVGFAFLLLLFYTPAALQNTDRFRDQQKYRFLAVLLMMFILLVHQVSTPQILLLLIILAACEIVVRTKRYVINSFFPVFISIFILYWGLIAYPFIRYLIPHTNPVLFEEVLVVPVLNLGVDFFVNRLDTIIFLFFGVVGILFLLWQRKTRYAAVFALFALLTLFIWVPNPLRAVWQVAELLRIDRFVILISPFMAFVMGVGIVIVAHFLYSAPARARIAGIVLLSLILVYAIGSTGIIRPDPGADRTYFTRGEVEGMDFVYAHVPYGAALYSDYFTARYFEKYNFSETASLHLPFYLSKTMDATLNITLRPGYVIFPERQFLTHGLTMLQGSEYSPGNVQRMLPTAQNIKAVQSTVKKMDLVYSNRVVLVYQYR